MLVDVRGALLNAASALEASVERAESEGTREAEEWLYRHQPALAAYTLRQIADVLAPDSGKVPDAG